MTTRTHRTENCRGVDARSRRKDLLAVGFALALAFPGAAHPYTLVQLLALPIERLLEPIDTATLAGKTVSIVGAFKLTNPNNWLVTPVKLDVQ